MLRLAIDSGPLHGPRTGIGNAVAWYLDELDRRADPEGIDVHRYLTSARATLEDGERRVPAPAALALRWWARSSRPTLDRTLGRPDVVHGTNYVVPPTRAPRVVSVYDCWFLDEPDAVHPDVRLASATLVRSLAEGATALASSQATADRLCDHLSLEPAQVEVVHLGPPGADHRSPSPERPDAVLTTWVGDDPFVLSLGTLERRKNVPALIRAFGRLAAEHPSVRLVVAGGDGDDSVAVDASITGLADDVRGRVRVTGRVTADTKDWLLHHAAALAYPSLDEGFGFPILEAQRAGLPVAASTAGSIPEVGGAGALYSAPDDTDALAANLFGLVDGSGRRARLVEAGYRNLERFSWADTVSATCDLYRRLAGTR